VDDDSGRADDDLDRSSVVGEAGDFVYGEEIEVGTDVGGSSSGIGQAREGFLGHSEEMKNADGLPPRHPTSLETSREAVPPLPRCAASAAATSPAFRTRPDVEGRGVEVSPPSEKDLEALASAAPMMPGAEYLASAAPSPLWEAFGQAFVGRAGRIGGHTPDIPQVAPTRPGTWSGGCTSTSLRTARTKKRPSPSARRSEGIRG
jgi:hypothetical protein